MKTKISEERIELRVLATDKILFKKAQSLSGDKSLTSFIVRIVKEHSEETLAKHNMILASEKDRQVFFDAVFGEGEPNQYLVEAAERFKSKSSF